MAVRVQLLTFQKDDLKSLIENTYPKVRERILKSAEEDIDDWDIETIDFLDKNEEIKNLIELKEEVSRVISSFFAYLEMIISIHKGNEDKYLIEVSGLGLDPWDAEETEYLIKASLTLSDEIKGYWIK